MASPGIFSTDQLAFIRKAYLSKLLPPRVVVGDLNAKFGTTFTIRQITSLVAERGWSARRKRVKDRSILAANNFGDIATAHQKAELSVTEEVVTAQIRMGRKIMKKAEDFVDTASSAKTLSSAASAARVGVSIVRSAIGLDSTNPQVLNVTFNPGFARSVESPFHPDNASWRRAERVGPAVKAVVAPVDVEPLTISLTDSTESTVGLDPEAASGPQDREVAGRNSEGRAIASPGMTPQDPESTQPPSNG